jgi:DNA-binding SARP family transcriptional activator
MSAPLARGAVPIVDAANPPTPLPAGAREWFGLSLGHFLEQGEIWGAWAGPEQAMLVLGPPRSGKTSSIVIPSVIGAPAAVVSTSTKPDVLLATCGIRQRLGTCYVFDPASSATLPEGTEELRWSPLSGCQSFDAAVSMAHALAGAGRPGAGHTEAAHWVERAEALLAPLFHAAAMAGKTMGELCGWVLGHDVREAEAILSVAGAQMAKVTLSSVWRTEERERSGIFSTAASLISVYRSESALQSANEPNFDPERFAASSDTVYVTAPAYAQDQLAPLVVALLEQIRAACYQRRRRHPDAAPTLFILDEVANIAPLPTLPQLASEGVSQGVVTLACLQDLSQARSRWGAVAEGFFSLFGTKLIFPGIADYGTLELVSALLGDEQVPMQSVSAPKPRGWVDLTLGMLTGDHRNDQRPVITNSTTFRRRLPVDAVYRGNPGTVLALGPGGAVNAAATPWWELTNRAVPRPPFLEREPEARPKANPSPWATPGARVVANSTPRQARPWTVVIRGEPLPPASESTAANISVTVVDNTDRVSSVVGEESSSVVVPSGRAVPSPEEARDGVMVRVLGPVEVLGWLETPNRRIVTELACFLVLHADRNVNGEELRAAFWSGDLGASEASAKSLRNAVSMLRKALGPALVPEAHRGAGYRLAPGVACDWAVFSELTSSDGPDSADRLREALALVRGAPFEGVPSGTFTWAWTELFVSRMEVAVASAARRLGELALADNDLELSVWAALQGLSASPYDRELWTMCLDASARQGRDALERAWKSAMAVLGEDARDLASVIERLRSQAAPSP